MTGPPSASTPQITVVMPSPRDLLLDAFRAAIAAVEPGTCVRRALTAESRSINPPHILAVGKAAVPMTRAAVETARESGLEPAAGLVIPAEPASVPDFEVVRGNHPVPGAASVRAAEAVAAFIERVPAGSPVWFLLSGGATSLMAGAEPPLTLTDLQKTFEVLLRSGLDIHAINLVRKRVTRWGGGKLGRALGPAQVLQIIISDVIGDDLAAIGSGPCVADPADTREVIARLREARVFDRLPAATRALLTAMAEGHRAETPKLDDPRLQRIRTVIAATNADARLAATEHARSLGARVHHHRDPVQGEASTVGRQLARELLAIRAGTDEAVVHVWGGETTVTVTGDAGLGGRCQELALAAAGVLAGAGKRQIALLAAGTDGRDGPTDAAGALVGPRTWTAIRNAGGNPRSALERHDSYRALASAGALVRTGPTGTNVMDLMIGYSGSSAETR